MVKLAILAALVVCLAPVAASACDRHQAAAGHTTAYLVAEITPPPAQTAKQSVPASPDEEFMATPLPPKQGNCGETEDTVVLTD